jgi:hypothetical protein
MGPKADLAVAKTAHEALLRSPGDQGAKSGG